jgi:hypothetical protein
MDCAFLENLIHEYKGVLVCLLILSNHGVS